MQGKGCRCGLMEKWKPYMAMICLQFGYAGMNIVTKVSLNKGMSHYVLVAYRQAFATAAIAPFALVLERNVRPKITFPVFMQMFMLGLLGPVIDQNLYYAGLRFTSPTFSCAISNMLPVMTFIIAVLCRMEKVDIRKIRCQAKVAGAVVTVAGAIVMTLYKGHVVNMIWSQHIHPMATPTTAMSAESVDKDWVNGSILLILATLAWASFLILYSITMRKYTAHLSMTAIVCGLGTLQSLAVTFVMEQKPSVWSMGFDMNLLAVAYAGIVCSSIAYYVQRIVMEMTGPVFVTSFSPLMVITVAIMSCFILAEKIFIGGIIGVVLMVVGSYAILWGKHKEMKDEVEGIPEAIKGTNNRTLIMIEDAKANTYVDIETQRTEANKAALIMMAISTPMPQPPMIAMEAPKGPSS